MASQTPEILERAFERWLAAQKEAAALMAAAEVVETGGLAGRLEQRILVQGDQRGRTTAAVAQGIEAI
jgi:hypothetical protein